MSEPGDAASAAPSVIVHTDGASRGNPGPAATGWVISNADGQCLATGGRRLGERTNNEAEYEAVLDGLQAAQARGARRVLLCSDSELLVRQIEGAYQVKRATLKPLHARVVSLIKEFEAVVVKHVPREENREADRAANRALDGHSP